MNFLAKIQICLVIMILTFGAIASNRFVLIYESDGEYRHHLLYLQEILPSLLKPPFFVDGEDRLVWLIVAFMPYLLQRLPRLSGGGTAVRNRIHSYVHTSMSGSFQLQYSAIGLIRRKLGESDYSVSPQYNSWQTFTSLYPAGFCFPRTNESDLKYEL